MEKSLLIEQLDLFKDIRISDTDGNAVEMTLNMSGYDAMKAGSADGLDWERFAVSCKTGIDARMTQERIDIKPGHGEETISRPHSDTKPPKDASPELNEATIVANALLENQGTLGNMLTAIELVARGYAVVPLGELESPLTLACEAMQKVIDNGTKGR